MRKVKQLHGQSKVIWKPQPGPQELMLSCPYEEILYGGAAGGGKTDSLLGDYAKGIEKYGEDHKGVIFRRTYPMLEELESRSLQIFGPAYGQKCYSLGNKKWKFPNGATLKFRFLEKKKDTLNYQGQQFNWIGFDELTQWPDDYCYEYLKTRLRSPSGAPCTIRSTSNPGGPGHLWVKEFFEIGKTPPLTPIVNRNGRIRIFIPAKVQDNLILMHNDPLYVERLDEISDPVLRLALKDGNWDVFAGQAFPEWRQHIHVVPDSPVPDGVTMWRACDWGFEKPYCVLWFYADYDGNVTVCNEIYGKGDGVNAGSHEAASVVRQKIETIENENNWWVPIGYLDPQCWASHDDTPSVFTGIGISNP